MTTRIKYTPYPTHALNGRKFTGKTQFRAKHPACSKMNKRARVSPVSAYRPLTRGIELKLQNAVFPTHPIRNTQTHADLAMRAVDSRSS